MFDLMSSCAIERQPCISVITVLPWQQLLSFPLGGDSHLYVLNCEKLTSQKTKNLKVTKLETVVSQVIHMKKKKIVKPGFKFICDFSKLIIVYVRVEFCKNVFVFLRFTSIFKSRGIIKDQKQQNSKKADVR